MPCGCLFDMTEDILFDMILFEMIVISESSFEMTLSSKSRKVRNDFLFDMMPDCHFDMTALNFLHACGVFRLSAV